MAWYCKNYNIDELKTENDYAEIIANYKKHMNYDINQSDIDDIDESDENIKSKESFSSSNYSSNYFSNSSSDSSNNDIRFNENNDNDKANSSSEDNNNNQNKNNKKDNKNNKNPVKKEGSKDNNKTQKDNYRKGKNKKNIDLSSLNSKKYFEDIEIKNEKINYFEFKNFLFDEYSLVNHFEKINLNKMDVFNFEEKNNFKINEFLKNNERILFKLKLRKTQINSYLFKKRFNFDN